MSCSICLTHFLKIGYNESCNDAFHEPFISPLNFSGAQKLMILSCGPLPLIYICSVCPENNNFLERAFYKKENKSLYAFLHFLGIYDDKNVRLRECSEFCKDLMLLKFSYRLKDIIYGLEIFGLNLQNMFY